MDWRTRIAAIVLAGGSVAGCAAAADPGDAGTPDAGPASTGGPWEPEIHPALSAVDEKLPEVSPLPRRRYRIPICNANPDPCCRSPHSPTCEGATPLDAGARLPE